MIICSVCHIECPTNSNIAIFSPEYCSTLLHSLHTAELVCCSPVLRKPIYCAASLYRRLAERAKFRRTTLMFFGPPPLPPPLRPFRRLIGNKRPLFEQFYTQWATKEWLKIVDSPNTAVLTPPKF